MVEPKDGLFRKRLMEEPIERLCGGETRPERFFQHQLAVLRKGDRLECFDCRVKQSGGKREVDDQRLVQVAKNTGNTVMVGHIGREVFNILEQ